MNQNKRRRDAEEMRIWPKFSGRAEVEFIIRIECPTLLLLMLSQGWAGIGSKDALGAIPDSLDVPLLKKITFTPGVFHYGSYADTLAAVEHCKLCALVVESFNSSTDWRPDADKPIHCSVECEEREKDLFPN